MSKQKHVCPKTRDDQYEWPCKKCCPDYYRKRPGVRWFIIEVISDLEPQIKGPFLTEFAMEKKARQLRESDRGMENGLYWMVQTNGKRPHAGSWDGGFFMKGEDKSANG